MISARILLFASAAAAAYVTPAAAQDAPVAAAPPEAPAVDTGQPSDAVTKAEAPTATNNEIVVTARRRAEVLQDVPIAITAYSGEQLERQGAVDLTDISETTPNVTFEYSRATNSTLTAFIRGVGQQDPVSGFEQGVGLYLDDVYLNRPQAAVLDIYDVDRIEVLRGPQGTLYGRNTIGGAIKYVTRRLSADPELRVRANLGTYKQADLIVSASTPVDPLSNLRIGASVARLSHDGFGRNLTTGKDNYNKDVWALRGTVEAEPFAETFFRLSGDYTWDRSLPRGGHRLITSFLTGAPVLGNVYDTRGGIDDPHQKITAGGATFLGEIGLGEGLKFRSITAYREDDSHTPIDFDALPTVDVDVPGIYTNDQFSQEAQLVVEHGRLNGVVGAYYLNAHSRTQFDVRLFATYPAPYLLTTFTDAEVDTKTTAIFADFSYDITPQFSVSLGGRYTWDKRIADIFRQFYLGGGSTVFGGAGIPFGTPQTDFQGSRSFNKFTPRASFSYKPTKNHSFYISYSQGFKGGSFDPRGTGVNAPDANGDNVIDSTDVGAFISFKPETVDSYEVGYKGSPAPWLDVAVAAFHADYKDVQIPGSAPCRIGLIDTFCGVTANAGKARFQGLEFEGNATIGRDLAAVGDRLNVATSMGYVDAKYLEYLTFIPGTAITPPMTADVADFRHVQNTPKWTASGTLDYSAPAWGGRVDANTTLSYRTKTYQFEIANPYIDQKGYALLDGNLVWTSPGSRYTIGLHARNILDKHYKTSGYTYMAVDPRTGELLRDANGNPIRSLGQEGVLSAFYGNPRQVWLSLGVNF
jgi:iron complex outermembrane receptor protein